MERNFSTLKASKGHLPVIGITIGDPSGVGPEIAVKALQNNEVKSTCIPILIGSKKVITRAMGIIGCHLSINSIESTNCAKVGSINVFDIDNVSMDFKYGVIQATCGQAAYDYIIKSADLAINKEIDAIVTGPINKEALNLAGINYSGHTEILADITKTKDYAMLLYEGAMNVIHVSTHVSLREACLRVKKDRVLTVIKLANDSMIKITGTSPRIAVAGLNPHAGENGLFGDEEQKEISPAIQAAKEEGINVYGPLPPDTVFLNCANGKFDIVVAMYHDQGHIPVKMVDIMSGVNITVGLPIIRTSVDHGTAFGKAGKGTADAGSMIKAIIIASKIMQ